MSLRVILSVLATLFLNVLLTSTAFGQTPDNPEPVGGNRWVIEEVTVVKSEVTVGSLTDCEVGDLTCRMAHLQAEVSGLNLTAGGYGKPLNMFYPFTICPPPLNISPPTVDGKTVAEKDGVALRWTTDFSFRWDGLPSLCKVGVEDLGDIVALPPALAELQSNGDVAVGKFTALYGYTNGYTRGRIHAFHSGVDTRSRGLYDDGKFVAAVYAPFPLLPIIVRSGAVFGATSCRFPERENISADLLAIANGNWDIDDCALVLWGGLHVMPETPAAALMVTHEAMRTGCVGFNCEAWDTGDILAPCKIDTGDGWGTTQPHCHYMLVVMNKTASRAFLTQFLSNPRFFIVGRTTATLDLHGLWGWLYTWSLDPLLVFYPPPVSTPEELAEYWARHPLPADRLAFPPSSYAPVADWTGDAVGDYAIGAGAPEIDNSYESTGVQCARTDKPVAGHLCSPAAGKMHGVYGDGRQYQYRAAQRAFFFLSGLR